MGRKAPSFCAYPSCGQLVVGSAYCDEHQPVERADRLQGQRDYNTRRSDSDQQYGSQRWRKLSVAFRRRYPLCSECESNGLVRAADLVDHIKPAKEFPELFFSWKNLRSLCHDCHNRIGEKVRTTKGEGGSNPSGEKMPRTKGESSV